MTRRFLAAVLILMMLLVAAAIPASAFAASRIHSLSIRQDPDNQRILYIDWVNKDDIECNLTITRIESNGKAVRYEVVNQWVEDDCYVFDQALPLTTYLVSVYQFGSGDVVSKTFSIGKAPSYSAFGATCHGGTMHWVERDVLESSGHKVSASTPRLSYSQMSTAQFAKMLQKYEFYGMSHFTHRYESYDRDIDVLYILRGPNGKDVFIEEDNMLPDAPANHDWVWYYPLEELIWNMSGTGSLTQPGSYMFEVYFDNCRLSRKAFVITR